MAQSNSSDDQRPTASDGKGAAHNQAGPIEAPAPPAAAQQASAEKAGNADEERPLRNLMRSWPWWVRALFQSEVTNFLIMVFTGALMVVAYLQNRLETKLAAEAADSIALAKSSADAAVASANQMANIAKAAIEVGEGVRRTERPYIFFSLGDLERQGETAFINLYCRNGGRTPAVMKRFSVTITNWLSLHEDPSYPPGANDIDVVVEPSTERVLTRAPLTYGQHFIYGFVVYEDVYSAEHTSRFAFQIADNFIFVDNSAELTYLTVGGRRWNAWE